jgi:hypothetical protein
MTESKTPYTSPNDLEQRLTELETQLTEIKSAGIQDSDRLDLVEKSFKTVLDADIHQDNKAGRILSAIAFLTAAATTLFTRQYTPGMSKMQLNNILSQELSPYINAKLLPVAINSLEKKLSQNYQFVKIEDIALWSYWIYMLFVVLGAGLYLCALGPSFNISSSLRNNKNGLPSLLFFEVIASSTVEEWNKEWDTQKSTGLIHQKMQENLQYETYLIAQKTRIKVTLMSIGSFCFRLSLASLIPLSASLFKIRPQTNLGLSLAGLSLVFFVYSYSISQKKSKKNFDKIAHKIWFLLTIVSGVTGICLIIN